MHLLTVCADNCADFWLPSARTATLQRNAPQKSIRGGKAIFAPPFNTATAQETRPPRAEGALRLSSKRRGTVSALDGFRVSGAMKALFPRSDRLQAIMINSAGGLTGGDRMEIAARAGPGSSLTLTTQAAERCYRALEGHARICAHLTVEEDAELAWLPQETILFDGSALRRRLAVDLSETGRLLLAEPVIFGRAAMGESVRRAVFHDEILVRRAGRPLYLDRVKLEGDIAAELDRPAVAAGARAMACILYVAPDAEARLGPARAALPETGGASLLAADVLTVRLLAADGFELRRTLLPLLDRLSRNALPRSWRL